jgi:hypothetical protein
LSDLAGESACSSSIGAGVVRGLARDLETYPVSALL